MSLIFKALQRFDSTQVTQDEGTPELPPKRNKLTLRNLLLSPSIAISVAAAIFVVGLIVSQAIKYFPHKMKPMTPSVQAAMPEKTAAPKPSAQEHFKVEADVEPEINKPISAEDVQRVSFQVHQPEPAHLATVSAPAESDAIRFQFVDSDQSQEGGGDSPVGVSSSQTPSAALPSKQKEAAVSPPDLIQKEMSANTDSAPPPKMLSFVRHEAPRAKSSVSETDDVGTDPTWRSNPSKRSGTNSQYRRQADQATKHLQVSQLANRIYGAIQADDVILTSNLLAKLARMKGADNLFVLKLKAFSLIRQDHLEEARMLLANVLARSPDDLDAGLNMAVIDMKTGRIDTARRRLLKLREMFPEDSNITLYLSKLPQ